MGLHHVDTMSEEGELPKIKRLVPVGKPRTRFFIKYAFKNGASFSVQSADTRLIDKNELVTQLRKYADMIEGFRE